MEGGEAPPPAVEEGAHPEPPADEAHAAEAWEEHGAHDGDGGGEGFYGTDEHNDESVLHELFQGGDPGGYDADEAHAAGDEHEDDQARNLNCVSAASLAWGRSYLVYLVEICKIRSVSYFRDKH